MVILNCLPVRKKLGSSTPLHVLWSVPTTEQLNASSLVGATKIADFLKAGCRVNVAARLHSLI